MDAILISKAMVISYNPKVYEITESLYFEPLTLIFNFKDFSPEYLCPSNLEKVNHTIMRYS
ncbi:MAG: hypothetical protein ACJ72S_01010, partial [Nitrososphaeraceae archaeon]